MTDLVLSVLNAVGINPNTHPYAWLSVLIIGGVVYLRYSIGGKLAKLKANLLIVISHLSATRTSRLDTNLIQAMSPLQIQPAGATVIEESGLKQIMREPTCRELILRQVGDFKPQTKLDVEQKSVILFETLMLQPYMNPVKTYLYEHPVVREQFALLAGLYIRDEYLKDHPEITQ